MKELTPIAEANRGNNRYISSAAITKKEIKKVPTFTVTPLQRF